MQVTNRVQIHSFGFEDCHKSYFTLRRNFRQMIAHSTCTSERKSGRLFIETFLFAALELSAQQPWLGQTHRRVRLQVLDCDPHVKRTVIRSNCSALPVCSFPFCVFSARSFVVARFMARSVLVCWFELLLRQASLSIIANCCGRSEKANVARLCFTFISGVVPRSRLVS